VVVVDDSQQKLDQFLPPSGDAARLNIDEGLPRKRRRNRDYKGTALISLFMAFNLNSYGDLIII
jgi:hypothetical protein